MIDTLLVLDVSDIVLFIDVSDVLLISYWFYVCHGYFIVFWGIVDIWLVLIAILEMHVFSQRRLFYTFFDMFQRK